MSFKSGILFLTLLVGSLAVPAKLPKVAPNEDLFFHTDTSARIVGGTEAAPGSAPHMVALTMGGLWRSFVCGGSLITTRTVLTAAHCVDDLFFWGSLSNNLLGNMGTNSWLSGGISFTFARNVTHQHWDRLIIKNDIGLLITTTDVRLSETVQIIPLSFEHIPGETEVKAMGWGRTTHEGYVSVTLLELVMKTIEGDQCQRDMPGPHVVDPQIELCTVHEPGFGMCQGDSGSALVSVATGKQIGIVSWGIPCATGAPDSFVRVSAFKDWLTEYVV